MSVLQAEVYEASRVLDVPDDKALRAAVALSAALTKVEDETARSFSKRDADIEAIRRDVSSIGKDVAGINTRLAVMQGDIKADMTVLRSDLSDRHRPSWTGDLQRPHDRDAFSGDAQRAA